MQTEPNPAVTSAIAAVTGAAPVAGPLAVLAGLLAMPAELVAPKVMWAAQLQDTAFLDP